jgi:signal transduction histidine kinase/DNA-binding response OmpR family regulator
MKVKPKVTFGSHRTTIYVSLVFLVLAASLQALVWAYWQNVLEPRLRHEAASQAKVLAHSQEIRLVDAILDTSPQRLQGLHETIDEILLFTDAASKEPLFLGLGLEIDYDVVSAERGSLDLQYGMKHCQDCFLSEVGLYSPISDELIGIARFRVSDRLFRSLSRDVHKTLFIQSRLGTLLLLVVWVIVIFLIRKINSSRRQAEIANQAKSAFLANMSHELRTPLNAIIGFSELMGYDTDLSEKHRENLAIIHRSGAYLLDLINDVLELSKIEAARQTLTETAFDLYEALDKVTEMIRPRAEKKNLVLEFERTNDLPRFVRTDERKLRQILLNLLGNAVKFTQEGGIALRVRSEKDDFDGKADGDTDSGFDALRLYFEVEDSGPGIAAVDRTRIFEAFTQTEGGHLKGEGTGLGLTISRQFARHLGGDIKVGGALGQGAVFEFTLLAKPASASEVTSHRPARRVIGLKPDQSTARRQPIRILVVDDHSENRALLQQLLKRVGFAAKPAENGREALALFKQWQPHLIWMDMRMPVMDGYEATKMIRRAAAKMLVPPPVILALTASAFKEDRDAVIAAGCDDFVRRPFRESEIFNKIEAHLGVDYIYEYDESPSTETTPSGNVSVDGLRSAITLLPHSVIQEFKTAIELSDMDRMAQAVAEIGEVHAALARGLKELVDTFQYDRILSYLDDVENSPVGNPGATQ